MIVLESAILLMGENVLPENQKILANWVEFDDTTGEQLRNGHQEIWIIPKDFENNEFWDSRPADLKQGDLKRWKNMDVAARQVAENLFNHLEGVIEDAIDNGDI